MIIGLGTDIVEVKRIKAAIAKNENFVTRIYTPAEIAYCRQKSRPEISFAARFAAKEAISKAFGTGIGKISWLDMEITNAQSGQPLVHLSGNCAMISQEKQVKAIHLTLSHTDEYAVATAILEGGNDNVSGNLTTDACNRPKSNK